MVEEERKCILDASFHASVSLLPSVVYLYSFSDSGPDIDIVVQSFRHTRPEYKEHWPQFPWFLRVIIIPWVLGWRYSG